MQAPGAWERPAALQQQVRQRAADAQIPSVEHEVDDAPQQTRTWSLEEPADELSVSPGQLLPGQAAAARAAHLGGHHSSSKHAVENPEQPYADASRPGSHGAWPGMPPISRSSSGSASSAPWFKAAAAEPRSQSSACPTAEEQLLEEHLHAECLSPRGGPGMHAQGNLSSKDSCELVPVIEADRGAQPGKLRREHSTSAEGAGAHGAHAADSSHDASQPDNRGSGSAQNVIPGIPGQAHRHAGTAAGSGHSVTSAAVPESPSGQVPDLSLLAASHAAQEPERAYHSGTTVPDHALLGAELASTAGQALMPTFPHGKGLPTSDDGQSSQPKSVASMRSMMPDQASETRDSGAALSVTDLSALQRDSAPHNSSAGPQPAFGNHQNAATLGCFAEQCGAAMQVPVAAADAVGRPGYAAVLERVAVAASSSLQEVAESRAVWMQLSAVISEADGILEDASGSSGASISSHSGQAGPNSPDSWQSSAYGGAASASSSRKPDRASCSDMQCSMRPAGTAEEQAASVTRSDADLDGSAPRTENHSLGQWGMSLPAQAASPTAATTDEGGTQSLPGCPDASVLPGSQYGTFSSGAGTPHITFSEQEPD